MTSRQNTCPPWRRSVALKLIKRADAPIGLVCNPVGGVQICAYLPQSLIESDEDLKNDLTARNFYSADGFNAYGADNYTQPCGLYNERIAPLQGLSFAAMLWYQGESDARDFSRAQYYRRALAEMIGEYRRLFGKKMIVAAAHIARDLYPMTPDGYNYINEAIDLAVKDVNAEAGDERAFSAPLFEMMADTGVNAIEPLEPLDPLGGVSVADAKKRVGDRVCLKGGVNTLTFMNGTTEDVERETRAVLEQGMAGGEFLLGSGDDFPRESKPENIKTFVETAHKYGKYPVKK